MQQTPAPTDPPHVPQPLGPRLQVARINAGLSHEDLAQRLGVAADSVASWESSERTPRVNRLVMLAGILDVSLIWLLEGREDEYMKGHETAEIERLRGDLIRLEEKLNEAQSLARQALEGLDEVAAKHGRDHAEELLDQSNG